MRSDRRRDSLTFCFYPYLRIQVFPQIVKLDAGFTHGIFLWGTLVTVHFPSPRMFVYFNTQVTSLHEHATSYEHVR